MQNNQKTHDKEYQSIIAQVKSNQDADSLNQIKDDNRNVKNSTLIPQEPITQSLQQEKKNDDPVVIRTDAEQMKYEAELAEIKQQDQNQQNKIDIQTNSHRQHLGSSKLINQQDQMQVQKLNSIDQTIIENQKIYQQQQMYHVIEGIQPQYFSQQVRMLNTEKMEEQLFKIVFIGNSAVGKSSLLIRFCDDQFRDMYLSTIGLDFRFKTLKVNNQGVKLQIWDTAGQERFRNITNSYYKGAQGIVLVYDLTNIKSFNDIKSCWMNELQHYADENVLLMLLGNKSDLANEETRQVSVEMAEEYAKEHNMKHFEVSAKTAEQVTQAFHDFTEKILANASTLKQIQPQQQLNKSKNKKKKVRILVVANNQHQIYIKIQFIKCFFLFSLSHVSV